MDDKFELFDVTPNSSKLRDFRKAFVDSLNPKVFYKIVCNRANWFYYKNGVFDVKKILGSKFFEFSMTPDKSISDDMIFNDFIEYGVSNVDFVRAVRDLTKTYYFYLPNYSLDKIGRKFVASPVIPLSEDVYNLTLLELKDFRRIDTEDASSYKDFFHVSDVPNFTICKKTLIHYYESGRFSLEEYNNIMCMFDKEEKLIRTLRK